MNAKIFLISIIQSFGIFMTTKSEQAAISDQPIIKWVVLGTLGLLIFISLGYFGMKFFNRKKNKTVVQEPDNAQKSIKPVFRPIEIESDLIDKLGLTNESKTLILENSNIRKSSKYKIYVQKIKLKINELDSFCLIYPDSLNSIRLLNKDIDKWKNDKNDQDNIMEIHVPVDIIEISKTKSPDAPDDKEIKWILKENWKSYLCAASVYEWTPGNKQESLSDDIPVQNIGQELTAFQKIFEILKNSLNEASVKIEALNNQDVKLKSVEFFLNEYTNAKDKEYIKILELKNGELQNNLNNAINKLDSSENENERLKADLFRYTERVSFADFATEYAQKALSFLDVAHKLEENAYELSDKLVAGNNKTSLFYINKSLTKYRSKICELDVSSWERELRLFASNNLLLKDSKIYEFSEKAEKDSKKDGLIFLLYNGLFAKYCSAVLILNEELSNLHVLTDISKNELLYFNSNVDKIVTSIENLSFSVEYVKLFSTLRNQANISGVRKIKIDIPGLESEDIVEIIEYAINYKDVKDKNQVVYKE